MKVTDEIKKPVVFISHASSDGAFANVLKQELEKVFANEIDVYCTSSPGAISPGKDWLKDIEEKLETAQAVIAIVTPVSIERPWLWFEVGATWGKGRAGNCVIYPLCAPEIKISDVPSPLDRLQALSMGKSQDLKLLFKTLISLFKLGDIKLFKAANISKRIPKYKDVIVKEVDLNDTIFYSGKYTGYSDDELMEVIDTELFRPDDERTDYSNGTRRESFIHNGKLIHFKQVDKKLDLPTGTAKRLLNKVASRYFLEPSLENHNIIRYERNDEASINL